MPVVRGAAGKTARYTVLHDSDNAPVLPGGTCGASNRQSLRMGIQKALENDLYRNVHKVIQ